MMLVMAIPAIFAALVIKSRSFDRNRYEFDPNRTWSVLEQGREFKNLQAADAAVKQEMERLALERKNLVDNVKKLDEAMLALRASRALRRRWRSDSRTCCNRWPESARASAWTARSNCSITPRRRSICEHWPPAAAATEHDGRDRAGASRPAVATCPCRRRPAMG